MTTAPRTRAGCPPEVVLRDVALDGARLDVRVASGVVAEIGAGLAPGPGAVVVGAHGGALLPGLHDHHVHLLATAAAARSTPVGPPQVRDAAGLAAALRRADRALARGRWLRAVGYHESVAGDLDRELLDRLVPDRPVRVQHRSGARWVLNSAAVAALALEGEHRPGLERDPAGRLTGRVHRGDHWLRARLPPEDAPDLAALGRRLAGRGVTAVTDATPYGDVADLALLAGAVAAGDLPQRVVVTGGPALAGAALPNGLERGPVKLVIDDAAYPALDEVVAGMVAAHRHGRNVAIHCVTRAALVLALAAWDEAGSRPGDRVEHGSVVPPELYGELRRHRLTVVTQPGLVAERGDDYLRDVDPDDLPHLYPCRSLLDAGVAVAGSTDAPFSACDPWRAVAAASTRRTAGGVVLGAAEAVPPRRALDLFLGDVHDPGGPPRRVAVGAPADLCLLACPLDDALAAPAEAPVRAVVCAGALVLDTAAG